MTEGTRPRIGIIGAGRVAAVLAPALAQAGYEVVAVASRQPDSARALAARIAGCRAVGSAQEVADAADLVFLTVPDEGIAQVAGSLNWRLGMAAVHCSGAAGLEPLSSAAQQGADVGSFHPLQTFAGVEVPLAGVTVAIEATGALLASLDRMALALDCRPIQLPEGARALYHASATIASNYLVTLLRQAARLWEPLGCSESEALATLLPLVKTTVANIESVGLRSSLTGPIARGDSGTVGQHLQALRNNAPDLVEMYRELGRKTLPLASLEPAQVEEIASILESKEKQACA